jgi:hypothetical protein
LNWQKDKTGGEKGLLPKQALLYFTIHVSNEFSAMIGFVEIANATYFIDTITGFHRDDAKTMCATMDMTLISFEADEQKWRAVTTWLNDNGAPLYLRYLM